MKMTKSNSSPLQLMCRIAIKRSLFRTSYRIPQLSVQTQDLGVNYSKNLPVTFTRSSVDTGRQKRKHCSQPDCTRSPLTHSKFVPSTQGEKTLGLRRTLGSVNYGVSSTGGINHYLGGLMHMPGSEHSKDKIHYHQRCS